VHFAKIALAGGGGGLSLLTEEANMPKRGSSQRPEQLRHEAEQIEKSGRSAGEKNPKNVAGGKKAAATRKQRGSRGGR
jgi:hypothetical protein